MNFKKKIFLFPLSLAVILFASIIIIFSPVGKKNIINVPDSTWQTYLNTQYGFEFNIPENYEVQEQTKNNYCLKRVGVNDGPSLCIFINVFSNSNKLSLSQFVKNNSNLKLFSWQKTDLFPEYSALSYDVANYLILSPNSKIIVEFGFSGMGNMEKQILSTFKFTK